MPGNCGVGIQKGGVAFVFTVSGGWLLSSSVPEKFQCFGKLRWKDTVSCVSAVLYNHSQSRAVGTLRAVKHPWGPSENLRVGLQWGGFSICLQRRVEVDGGMAPCCSTVRPRQHLLETQKLKFSLGSRMVISWWSFLLRQRKPIGLGWVCTPLRSL